MIRRRILSLLRSSFPSVIAFTALSQGVVSAAPIFVPNHSFETPDVNFAGSFDSTPAAPWQFTQTSPQQVGAFDNTAPGSPNYIDNVDGAQVAYLFPGPGISLFQDLSSPGATFDIGKFYTLTVGAGGSSGLIDGSQLQLRLFYRDGQNNKVTVATSSYTFDPLLDPGEINHLYDRSVASSTVQAGDAWAGKNIGIEISSPGTPAFAYWDVDNVRVEAVPEPSACLYACGGLMMLLAPRRRSARREG